MTPEQVSNLFSTPDGAYFFARWGRPLSPVVFGVEDETLDVMRSAFHAVADVAGHSLSETDPELGANVIVFFFRDWEELSGVPNLDRMIDDLPALVSRMKTAGAQQYRTFRFDEGGAIRACFSFVQMAGEMTTLSASAIALTQAVQTMLVWSEAAFSTTSPLAIAGETTILRPEIAAVLKAAYDPVMPAVANDPSHALRLFARIGGPE